MMDQRGLSLVEIAIVLVVLAIARLRCSTSTSARAPETLEQVQEQRPLSHARLTADKATVQSIRTALQIYHAQNGKWPESKDAVASLLSPPPNFQCQGNDYTYDPGTGQVGLMNEDPGRSLI